MRLHYRLSWSYSEIASPHSSGHAFLTFPVNQLYQLYSKSGEKTEPVKFIRTKTSTESQLV